MNETEMGYRGSKSDLNSRFVKEQRVDGSYFSLFILEKLRCTLMDCESNYPVSNPSKLIIIHNYKVQGQMPFLYKSFYIDSFLCHILSKKNKQFLIFKKPSSCFCARAAALLFLFLLTKNKNATAQPQKYI
jgi:hypothetical protein